MRLVSIVRLSCCLFRLVCPVPFSPSYRCTNLFQESPKKPV